MVIKSKAFSNSITESHANALEEWSKGIDPSNIISISYTNGTAYVFYWAEEGGK